MAFFRIRFITEKGFVSWAIRQVTFSEFSHAEIVSEDQTTYIGAHSDGGVQERPANYCSPTFERRYAIPCTDDQLKQIMAYARSKIGTRYNFKDIVGLFFHHNLTTKGRVICSMFVHQAAWKGGLEMLNVLPDYANLVTPDSLHLSPLLIGRCYYESQYPK